MALPLTGGGCYPNHNAATPIFNDLCQGWRTTSVKADKFSEDVVIRVSGSYNDFDGEYILTINSNGIIGIDYRFIAKTALNPRQWGMVFATDDNLIKRFGIVKDYGVFILQIISVVR